ncbi:hypothetical protein Cyrtocomes_01122 [Candidatus Cyrtobacter comes]|uniref:PhoU domain-containing protein n=1 Tax=Candidatus Cyrtobacter comes TaxID=675776 RepID=A0ABU5L9D9_9RICK|nr:hypothetical protein [Candidatus Cyrtobacter comes]MDZ5762728.1 hypothetical protein [Candidatus Cyrtobacter comes]
MKENLKIDLQDSIKELIEAVMQLASISSELSRLDRIFNEAGYKIELNYTISNIARLATMARVIKNCDDFLNSRSNKLVIKKADLLGTVNKGCI